MQKTSFCIGIYSVWWPSTFLQKTKKTKKCCQNEGRFSRGLSTPLFHRFSSILDSILGGFWEPKSGKTRFGEGRKNDQKKGAARAAKSHASVYRPGGGVPYNPSIDVPHPCQELLRRDKRRLKPYEHTTTCVEARWRIRSHSIVLPLELSLQVGSTTTSSLTCSSYGSKTGS